MIELGPLALVGRRSLPRLAAAVGEGLHRLPHVGLGPAGTLGRLPLVVLVVLGPPVGPGAEAGHRHRHRVHLHQQEYPVDTEQDAQHDVDGRVIRRVIFKDIIHTVYTQGKAGDEAQKKAQHRHPYPQAEIDVPYCQPQHRQRPHKDHTLGDEVPKSQAALFAGVGVDRPLRQQPGDVGVAKGHQPQPGVRYPGVLGHPVATEAQQRRKPDDNGQVDQQPCDQKQSPHRHEDHPPFFLVFFLR